MRKSIGRGIIETAMLGLLCLGLVGCGDATVPVGPTDPVATPKPAPTQTVLKLATAARQGGNVVREVAADTFFIAEAVAVCEDKTLDCPRLVSVQWSATGFCDFYSDITSPQVLVKCLGGGTARLEVYSRLYNTSGILQIGVNIQTVGAQ